MDTSLVEQMEVYDLKEVGEKFDQLFPGFQLDMNELFSMILNGNFQLAAKKVLEAFLNGVTGELESARILLASILIIGILSGIYVSLSDMIENNKIGQIGFYALYLSLIAVLMKSFVYVAEIATLHIKNMILFIQFLLPIWSVSVEAAMGGMTAVFYCELLAFVIWILENILLTCIIPFIYVYILLSLLGGIWAEERLIPLLELIKKGVELALKLALSFVTGLSFVQSLILPVSNRLRMDALQKTISMIPGIGQMAGEVSELFIDSAVLIKNSIGILFLLLLLAACALPVLKIMLIAGVIELSGAIAGIMSDKRISDCTGHVGQGCYLLGKCLLSAAALFMIVIVIVSGASK